VRGTSEPPGLGGAPGRMDPRPLAGRGLEAAGRRGTGRPGRSRYGWRARAWRGHRRLGPTIRPEPRPRCGARRPGSARSGPVRSSSALTRSDNFGETLAVDLRRCGSAQRSVECRQLFPRSSGDQRGPDGRAFERRRSASGTSRRLKQSPLLAFELPSRRSISPGVLRSQCCSATRSDACTPAPQRYS
jgi:hypothetical protein